MCAPNPFVNIFKLQVVMKLCRCYSGFGVVVVVAPRNEP